MSLDYTNWWEQIEPLGRAALAGMLVPIGLPGFAGAHKHAWQMQLDALYGADGWRMVLHHASPVPPASVGDESRILH